MLNCPDFYYDDVEEDPFDPKSELIHSCGEYMREIVGHLFGDGDLNRIALDDAISGICNLLEVDIPPKMLTIERSKTKKLFSNSEARSLYITKKTI